jgi:ribosome-binding factor A
MIVSELSDPRIGFLTVTRVEVSPDMTLAKVYVSVMGTPEKARAALRGLDSARKRIRLAVGKDLTLRHTPEIAFFADPGIERSFRISGILSDLARERAEREGEPDGQDSDVEEEDGDDR